MLILVQGHEMSVVSEGVYRPGITSCIKDPLLSVLCQLQPGMELAYIEYGLLGELLMDVHVLCRTRLWLEDGPLYHSLPDCTKM